MEGQKCFLWMLISDKNCRPWSDWACKKSNFTQFFIISLATCQPKVKLCHAY